MQKVKKFTKFYPRVRSRHPSHDILREELPALPFKSIVRLGSTTALPGDNVKIECNSIEGIKNSSNKFLMKKCFENAGVKHAQWFTYDNGTDTMYEINSGLNENQIAVQLKNLEFPMVAKAIYGSRGKGNTLLTSLEALKQWLKGKDTENYIFEKFYSYTREYRLHITEEGCFYTCRKLLKNDAPDDKKWQRHDDNCVWIVETNPSFNKPVNWDVIVQDCVKALKKLKLDVAAFDVKVQSAKDKKGKMRNNPEYILLESNSAPSFGDITTEKYLIEIPRILKRKYERHNI